uniref:Uncharacterized protein n=1 Tax=Arundo donax TaxID=35708 RepID=A0A0A9E4B2_ARUDO
MRSPPQPLLYDLSQSISSCSERLTREPVLILFIPSIAPVAEKLQQAPQLPWSLTLVTAPLCLQSTASGKAPTPPARPRYGTPPPLRIAAPPGPTARRPRRAARNSSCVRSAKALSASV